MSKPIHVLNKPFTTTVDGKLKKFKAGTSIDKIPKASVGVINKVAGWTLKSDWDKAEALQKELDKEAPAVKHGKPKEVDPVIEPATVEPINAKKEAVTPPPPAEVKEAVTPPPPAKGKENAKK